MRYPQAVNDELEKWGYSVRILKASGYFYFQDGEADNWLDKTVSVPTVNSLSLAEWVAEYERLEKLNAEIMGGKSKKLAPKPKQTKRR